MSFVRPEARAALMRWREVIVGLALGGVGLWLITRTGVLLSFPGFASLAGGIALIWLGIQRARFRGPGGGRGAVQVDEGQVTYFGPLSGGMVALQDLESLTLDGAMYPAHWQLVQDGQPPLMIPVDAEGADALFDAFATLPGMRTQRLLSALQAQAPHAVLIWQRGPLRPAGALLH